MYFFHKKITFSTKIPHWQSKKYYFFPSKQGAGGKDFHLLFAHLIMTTKAMETYTNTSAYNNNFFHNRKNCEFPPKTLKINLSLNQRLKSFKVKSLKALYLKVKMEGFHLIRFHKSLDSIQGGAGGILRPAFCFTFFGSFLDSSLLYSTVANIMKLI